MRIAIDGETLCDVDGGVGAGIEHYTWEMIRAMLQQKTPHVFIIFLPQYLSRERVRTLTEGAQSRFVLMRPLLPRISFFSHHIFFPLRVKFLRADAMWSPHGQLPLGWVGPSIATIHDVSIYEHPEWFSALGSQDFSQRIVVPRTIDRADRLVAVSKTTADRLVRMHPEVARKTMLVHEGVRIPEGFSVDGSSSRFPFDRDVILFLGTIEPRKNLGFAIRAFDTFLRQHPECANTTRLIIAGKRGWGAEEVEKLAHEMNQLWSEVEPSGVVHFLGAVTEEEKWTLFARASVFVFPSLDEGFGLPVLEAMSVGTPVITSKAEALLEVGGDAVIAVSDVESFAFSIAQCLLLPEGSSVLRKEGKERAKLFTWDEAAKKMIAVFESVRKEKDET